METWPTNLPMVGDDFNYTAQAVDARSTVVEAWLDQRHRYDGQTSLATVSWQMDDATFALFETFFKFSINNGSDWFNMALPISGIVDCQVRFNGATFASSYKEGKVWVVTAKLDIDIVPNDIPDEATLDSILDELSGMISDDGTYQVDDTGDALYFNV